MGGVVVGFPGGLEKWCAAEGLTLTHMCPNWPKGWPVTYQDRSEAGGGAGEEAQELRSFGRFVMLGGCCPGDEQWHH